jgi:hypothetical protein
MPLELLASFVLQSSISDPGSEGGWYVKLFTVGVGVGVGVGVATGVGVGVGTGSAGLKTGFRFGLGAALTVTPLFHTSLDPDLTQVNFFPAEVAVAPALVHLAPAFTAAFEGAEIKERERITDSNNSNFLRME